MSERVVGGITFRTYAAVYAATAEGFSLEEALQGQDIEADGWAAIEEAWSDAMTEDLESEGTLSDEFEALLLEMQEGYRRPIPPLDEDLGAWIRFVRAWSGADAPMAFLRDVGLGPNDMLRLHRHWSAGIAADGDLRQRALQLLQSDDTSFPKPRPEPLKLRAAMPGTKRARPIAPRPPLDPALPPLSVTLPEPAAGQAALPIVRAPRKDVRVEDFMTEVHGMLPFLPAAKGAPVSEGTQLPEDPNVNPFAARSEVRELREDPNANPFAAIPVPAKLPPVHTVVPKERSLSDELSLAQYAALCAELEVRPHDSEEIFLKYCMYNQKRRVEIDREWRERLETRTGLYAEWRQLYQHFRDHFVILERMKT